MPAVEARSFDVIGIHHVQLAMPAGREADAEAFYAGVLGLTPAPKPEPLARRGGRWFRGTGVEVHLGVEAFENASADVIEPVLPIRLHFLAECFFESFHALVNIDWSGHAASRQENQVHDIECNIRRCKSLPLSRRGRACDCQCIELNSGKRKRVAELCFI